MTHDIFEAIFVSRAEAQSAYGLLTLARPALDLNDWTSALPPAAVQGQETGLIGMRDATGCIHSLFTYRVMRPTACEPTLQLSEFASLRLPGSSLIEELWRFANDLASQLGLSVIAIEMEPSGIWGRDRRALEQRGFAVERVMMRGKTQRPGLQVVRGR